MVNISNPSPDWNVKVYWWGSKLVGSSFQPFNDGNPIECGTFSAATATVNATCYNLTATGTEMYTFGVVGVRKSDGFTTEPSEKFVTSPTAATTVTLPLTLTAHTNLVHFGQKSITRSDIFRGQTYSYTISSYDNFNTTYQAVTVTDNIDPQLTIVSAAISGGGSCQIAGQVVTCTSKSKYNAPLTTQINVTVKTTATVGALIGNSAVIGGSGQNFTTNNVSARVN